MNNYAESKMTGIQAYSDRFICKDNFLYFASVFGNAESVKGTLAGFCSHYDWTLNGKTYCRIAQSYAMTVTKISPAITHGLIYVPTLFTAREIGSLSIVYGETQDIIAAKVFARLKKKTAVPLLDTWSGIILKDTCSFTKLETFGIPHAYEVELPADEELEQYVLDNIKILKGCTI